MSYADGPAAGASSASLPFSAFDSSMLPVHIVGHSGTLYYTNERGLSFVWGVRYTRDQVLGRTLMELGPAEYYAERVAFIAKMIDKKSIGVIRSLRQGGQTFAHVRPLPVSQLPEPSAMIVIELRIAPLSAAELADVELLEPATQDLGVLALLSPRELEVLAYVGMGLSVEETAARLHRSRETVISHRKSLMRKLACTNASHLAVIAVRAGLKPQDAERLRHISTGQSEIPDERMFP